MGKKQEGRNGKATHFNSCLFSHEAKAARRRRPYLARLPRPPRPSAALVGLPFHLVGKRWSGRRGRVSGSRRRGREREGREVIRLPDPNERGKRTAAIERNLCGGRGKFLSEGNLGSESAPFLSIVRKERKFSPRAYEEGPQAGSQGKTRLMCINLEFAAEKFKTFLHRLRQSIHRNDHSIQSSLK